MSSGHHVPTQAEARLWPSGEAGEKQTPHVETVHLKTEFLCARRSQCFSFQSGKSLRLLSFQNLTLTWSRLAFTHDHPAGRSPSSSGAPIQKLLRIPPPASTRAWKQYRNFLKAINLQHQNVRERGLRPKRFQQTSGTESGGPTPPSGGLGGPSRPGLQSPAQCLTEHGLRMSAPSAKQSPRASS